MSENPHLAQHLISALKTTGASIVGAGVATDVGRHAAVEPTDHLGSRFEIGSITKGVTGLVLASLVLDGEASLDDPVGKWLDAGPNGEITLGELATHTSGLPRLAPNHSEHRVEHDPYSAYTAAMAEDGLRESETATKGEYLYSNFGFQLLGLCIERLTGRALPDLFAEVVFDPLGMTDATVDPAHPVLQGEGDAGPVANWTLLLHGPGGINAPMADLLALIDAVLRPPNERFAALVDLSTESRATGPGAAVGLGWLIHPAGIVCMGGGTAGFSTYVAASRPTGRAVAVAANKHVGENLQTFSLSAAQGRNPLDELPKPFEGDTGPPSEVALKLFDCFVSEDYTGARRLMHPQTAETLTEDRLRGGWQQLAAQCGPLQTPEVEKIATARGMAEVTVAAAGEHRPLTMVVWLTDDLLVGGLVIR